MKNLEKLVEELKSELLGKEMTLLEVDNKVEGITGSTTSLFDYGFEEVKSSCSYYIQYNDETDMDEEILVEYEIVEDNEEQTDIIVKVTNVSRL